MKELKYVEGDVTKPIGDGDKLICHIVNDLKIMGSGVAKALFDKWPQVRSRYMDWEKPFFHLGNVQYISTDDAGTLFIVNMIAQHMVGQDENGNPPIRYDALIDCFRNVVIMNRNTRSVHIPYLMGCDRAGGDWDIVEKIIINELCSKDIDVTIYKWKG